MRYYYGANVPKPVAVPTGGKVQGAVQKGVAVAFIPVKFAVHTVGSAAKKAGELIFNLSNKF